MKLTSLSLGLAATLALMVPMSTPAASFNDILAQIEQLQGAGELARAEALATETLAGLDLPPDSPARRALEYEVERSRRIRQDYSLDRAALLTVLAEGIRDFQPAELDALIAAGRIDRLVVDGEERFFGSTRANLFFRYPELRSRRIAPVDETGGRFLVHHTRAIRAETARSAQLTGAPRRFKLTMTITVPEGSVAPGANVAVWMPFPQQNAFQSGIEVLSASPEPTFVNAPNYPTRTLHFRAPAAASGPTVFTATYTMTTQPRRIDIDPAVVASVPQDNVGFLDEKAPHVVFSDRVRTLAAEIVGTETNPAIKARRIYNWIANNLWYSYAREYSTLRCIPEYVLENGYGDCGQIALTFITLCRAAGVPARWQSGWVIYPHHTNLHDWSEIYLAPYGWVPVDADFAMGFRKNYDYLSPEEKDELVDFYFGGLDAYRLAANVDHGHPHFPPKADFRSDDVDSQRGEVEVDGRNLYFDGFGYRLQVEYLDTAGDLAPAAEKGERQLLAPGIAR
jgi:transglutaminase-like putative cysteine protease